MVLVHGASMTDQKKIAVASCADLPEWEVDDHPLIQHLSAANHVRVVSWDDESIDWQQFDAVLLRTTWDYHKHLGKFLRWAACTQTKTVLLNDFQWIEWNAQKLYLKDLERQGCRIAPTIWIPKYSDIDNLHIHLGEKSEDSRWFLKPTVGACASHTLRFSKRELKRAHSFLDAHLNNHAFMLQPYLDSVETEGEVSLLYVDNILTHAVRKVPVKGDYRVQDDFGADDMLIEAPPSLIQAGTSILAACQRVVPQGAPLLYARLDFLLNAKGEWLLNEAELIEPSMFFRHCQDAAMRLADGLMQRLP